jgi:phage shock protein PspC (stress-responsive transcriptional regulator)
MVPARRGPDDAPMTTERTDTAMPNEPLATYRRLERRTSNRVVGGVAGGLADYLNVDPILIRVGFAGLMLFSGAGIPLYLLGWLFIPLAGHPDSVAMGWLRSLALRPGTIVVLGILALLLFVSFPVMRRLDDFTGFYVPGEIWLALGIAFVGLLLLLPRGRGGAGVAPPPAAAMSNSAETGATSAPSYWASAPAPAAPIPAEPPRPASPLGWYALAATFIAIGIVALIDNLSTMQIELADYFGVALVALGLGLVVGAWRGRARALILIGLALLPFALAASFIKVPLDGGWGNRGYQPQSISELQPEYRLLGGSMYFDLSQLEGQTGPIDLRASVGVGSIAVVLPRDASIDITSSVEGGSLNLFGRDFGGTSVSQRVVGNEGGDGATIHLRLDVGIGDVYVTRVDQAYVDEMGG